MLALWMFDAVAAAVLAVTALIGPLPFTFHASSCVCESPWSHQTCCVTDDTV